MIDEIEQQYLLTDQIKSIFVSLIAKQPPTLIHNAPTQIFTKLVLISNIGHGNINSSRLLGYLS